MSTATAASGTQVRATKARASDRRRARRPAASDRRYHQRFKLDLLVNRFVEGHPYMCRMIDISRTGARLVPILEPASHRPPRFTGLQFQLPGQLDILTASGEIMDGSEPFADRGLGVRFTNLPPDAAWAIEAFLDEPPKRPATT